MIRALIGRFVLHCMEVDRRKRRGKIWRTLDLSRMTDGQISQLVHGRRVETFVPRSPVDGPVDVSVPRIPRRGTR